MPEKEMVLVLGSDQVVNQDVNRCSIGTKHMNVTRLIWTRLMCSRNRQELETLQSKLSKAGIPSEIRYNPVEAKRRITRLEIVVDERDLFRASNVRQGLETVVSAFDAATLKSLECQLAEQARQREQLLNERRDEQEQMRVCVGKVNALCSRVRAVLAAREKQYSGP